MSNSQNYKQCKLINGTLYDIVWIPTQFAKIGKGLSLSKHIFPDGWMVSEVYEGIRTMEEINSQKTTQKIWESCLK